MFGIATVGPIFACTSPNRDRDEGGSFTVGIDVGLLLPLSNSVVSRVMYRWENPCWYGGRKPDPWHQIGLMLQWNRRKNKPAAEELEI